MASTYRSVATVELGKRPPGVAATAVMRSLDLPLDLSKELRASTPQ